ncbi:hypothetical protein P691DRAFT_787340 [Macrolepiota fuliginosa MF-IS2]|uniref:Fungal-type protein kinase domain-containing protein n=1 Tax=Macrolepiota fuliginosa MF-IS2 TaxID=1400762 RepID=A0A9P5XKQ7_9AGAR|nr:hypothetical protein P691DRAFT_787340 [Macrolepiota fuliginosa MF-IS2]
MFSPLKKIADVISTHWFTGYVPGRVSVPHVGYRDCPNRNVFSELRGSTVKIDGCFKLNEDSGDGDTVVTSNIAVFAEYEKQLISVFLSFIFADRAGLGYDPMVHRSAPEGETITYTYEFPLDGATRFFKSTESLFGYQSLGIAGRMTRVRKAVEVSPGGFPIPGEREVALKDVRLGEDAMTEKSIQDAIFTEVEKQKDPKANGQASRLDLVMQWKTNVDFAMVFEGNGYQNYFVKIEGDYEGTTMKFHPQGAILTTGLFSPDKPRDGEFKSYRLPPSHSTRDHGDPTCPIPSRVTEDRSTVPCTYKPKKRYIIVYSEICTALHDIPDLKTSFQAFNGVIIAGWLHRDVSTGNILFSIDGETVTGKLSDLEYAKEFGSTNAHSKTGTPYFMAVELLTGVPHIVQEPFLERVALYRKVRETIKNRAVQSPHQSQPSAASGELIYNFQHDLESLLWIALWIISVRVNYALSQTYVKCIYVSQIRATPERTKIPVSANRLESISDRFHLSVRSCVALLGALIPVFTSAYTERNKAGKILDADIYLLVIGAFSCLADCASVANEDETFPGLIDVHIGEPIKKMNPIGPP